MDDHSLPDRSFSGDDVFARHRDWRFDLVRAQRGRVQQDGTLALEESRDRRIQTLTEQVGQLVREYAGTAERVGANFNQALLLRVVEALAREPLGNRRPIVENSGLTTTERFLAESLCGEILEVSLATRGASEEDSPLLAPEEWLACLEVVCNSLAMGDSF